MISLCPSSFVRALSTFCFKRLLLQNGWTDFEIILQEGFFGDTLPKLLKPFLNKMAARAKNKKKLLTTSSPEPVDGFRNNYIGMFLG